MVRPNTRLISTDQTVIVRVSEIAWAISGSENVSNMAPNPSASAFLNTSAVGHATSRNT